MSDAANTGRRRFLAGLAGLGLAALAGGGLARVLCAGERRPLGLDRARALLPHWKSAVAVGSRYLAGHPDEADAELLAELLELPAELPPPDDPAGRAALAALAESLHSRHRADFRDGRVAEVAGWTLSLTELRLAAIASLTDS